MRTRTIHPVPTRRNSAIRGLVMRTVAVGTLALAAAAPAQVAMKEPPPELQGVELVQKPGAQAPPELEFTRADGVKVHLGEYFNRRRPVVLSLVYFRCPMICPLTLSRLMERVNGCGYRLGEDFDVVVISFDHSETVASAAEARDVFFSDYSGERDDKAKAGFQFHISDVNNVRLLAAAVGFPYKYIPESNQYSHGSAVFVLTPDGRVARYLDGLSGDGRELKLALLEASQGKVSRGLADFFLHKCYVWDASTGKYTLSAMRVMQLGGFISVTAVLTLIVALRAGERARAHGRDRRAARTNAAPRGAVVRPTP